MTITNLVQTEPGTNWRWADTQKSARIKRNIGDEVTFDFSGPRVHPDWRKKPVEFARLHAPYVSGLPNGTEVSFYVVRDNSSGEPPSITVQYVEAKR